MSATLPWLTLLNFLPLLGATAVWMLGKGKPGSARGVTLAFNLATLLLALYLWNNVPSMRVLEERADWIPSLGVQYFLRLDGLSLLMVFLSAIVVPFAVLASGEIREKPHLYYALMLCVQTGLFGAFTAMNFFHWFIFWELILVPAYFLIKLWGGPRRSEAAMQFFIYTLVGSVTMLLGFVALYLGARSFDFLELAQRRQGMAGGMTDLLNAKIGGQVISPALLPWLVFAGIFLGFAIKVPLMPLHSWLPLAYTEAPTGVVMVLTGAMSKMGVYGFLRILLPLFPEQMRLLQKPLLVLAVGSIVLSALAALAHRDLKRMLAYSSINHLGYCLLGIFTVVGTNYQNVEKSAALNGVMLQMFNHGVTAAALFCFVAFIERRSHGLRGLDDFGGLRKPVPVLCGLMGIALFASLGLPGLNGFVGEFLIFKGVFPLAGLAAAISVLGLLVTAVFLLTILQRVFSGPVPDKWKSFPDLTITERLIVLPAIALMFLVGLWPQLLLNITNGSVLDMLYYLTHG